MCSSDLLSSVPGIISVGALGEPEPAHDVWVDQMSLPRLCLTRLDTIPFSPGYIAAAPARIAKWKSALPQGRKIGIVWAGNSAHSNDSRRSMPVGTLTPLLETKNATFVSLQTGRRADEVRRLGAGIFDLSPYLIDWAETAAIVANLDLVIAVDTAVAHLAGAMGVPVWTLLPHAPDWRWMLARDDTPWYRSMRLFRQEKPGDWAGVTARVARTLAE